MADLAPPPWFADVLRCYPRVAVAGGPRTGKTTLVSAVADRPILHTDDLMSFPWEQVPHLVIQRATKAGRSFVVEGVQVPRALRKGLAVDAVVWLGAPRTDLTPGQHVMSRAVHTVFEDWRANIPAARGVPVFREPR